MLTGILTAIWRRGPVTRHLIASLTWLPLTVLLVMIEALPKSRGERVTIVAFSHYYSVHETITVHHWGLSALAGLAYYLAVPYLCYLLFNLVVAVPHLAALCLVTFAGFAAVALTWPQDAGMRNLQDRYKCCAAPLPISRQCATLLTTAVRIRRRQSQLAIRRMLDRMYHSNLILILFAAMLTISRASTYILHQQLFGRLSDCWDIVATPITVISLFRAHRHRRLHMRRTRPPMPTSRTGTLHRKRAKAKRTDTHRKLRYTSRDSNTRPGRRLMSVRRRSRNSLTWDSSAIACVTLANAARPLHCQEIKIRGELCVSGYARMRPAPMPCWLRRDLCWAGCWQGPRHSLTRHDMTSIQPHIRTGKKVYPLRTCSSQLCLPRQIQPFDSAA
jgi:hypothetical protein